MSNLETEIAAEYGVTIDVENTEIDEPWNTERGGIEIINSVSEYTGRVVAWLVLGTMGVLVADVFSRTVLGSAIPWANDMAYFLYSFHFVLGAAFTLKRNGHIRTDFVYRKWSARRQALTDAIVYAFLFLPALCLTIYVATEKGLKSFDIREEAITSNSGLPLWTLKVMLPIGIILWLLQSISELVKSMRVVRSGEWQ